MSDERQAPSPRESLLLPVVIPLGVLAVIGLVLWGFSRVLLRLKPQAATATALFVAAAIVAIVAIAASRKRVGNGSLLSVVVGVAGVGMLASGAALLVGGSGGEAAEEVAVPITAPAGAAASGFAETSVSAPADEPFTITFDNQDAGVQHNVVLASDDPAKDPSAQTLLAGTLITGPAAASYPVPALPEGEFYFYCEIHPTTMSGTLTAAPGPPPVGGGPITTEITASDLLFDITVLTLPDEGAKLTFHNNDDGVPHNVEIYTDASATTSLFEGASISGVATTTYDIGPLEPGSYYFHCDFHPDGMNGTVVVVPAGGPGGGGGGPPASGSEPSALPSAAE